MLFVRWNGCLIGMYDDLVCVILMLQPVQGLCVLHRDILTMILSVLAKSHYVLRVGVQVCEMSRLSVSSGIFV